MENNIIELLKRLISEQGMQATIQFLLSDEISDKMRTELTENHIFVGGYPCLCSLCTLQMCI